MHRATLESTADGILVVDCEGHVVSYNRRFLDLWRIPERLTTTGRDADLLQFVLDQVRDRDAFMNRVEQLYAAPEESSYDEIAFTDGRVFERYSQPQHIDGVAVGRVWSFRDVTEARRSDEALRFSEDKFAKAFRSSPLRVSISTLAEGRFVEVNETFLRDHGFTREQVIGRTSPELGLWADPNQRRRLVDAVRRNGMVRDYEFAGQLRDGRIQTTSISAEVIQVGGEACLLSVATDVTERKEAEEKARRSRAELRALAARLLLVREEERTRIAREIHDELGQALTGLKLDLAWLKQRVDDRGELSAWVQSIVERIDGTIDSVRRIATDLRPSILDHLGLVAAIEWQAQEFERRTGVKASVRVSRPEVAIDDVRATAVFRMLQETLTNVARHAGATRVDIDLTVGNVDLSLDVRDDGRGITPAEIAGGRSLGLRGSPRAGHRLWRDARNSGNSRTRDAGVRSDSASRSFAARMDAMIRLLIADDHPVVREGLRRIVADHPELEVVGEAVNGDEVLTLLRRLPADVVLLDIAMPGPGFLQVLEHLRVEHPSVAVLVLSVHPEDQYAVRALRSGAAGYLTKDHSPEQLVDAIRKVHRGGRVRESHAGRAARDRSGDGRALGTPGTSCSLIVSTKCSVFWGRVAR